MGMGDREPGSEEPLNACYEFFYINAELLNGVTSVRDYQNRIEGVPVGSFRGTDGQFYRAYAAGFALSWTLEDGPLSREDGFEQRRWEAYQIFLRGIRVSNQTIERAMKEIFGDDVELASLAEGAYDGANPSATVDQKRDQLESLVQHGQNMIDRLIAVDALAPCKVYTNHLTGLNRQYKHFASIIANSRIIIGSEAPPEKN